MRTSCGGGGRHGVPVLPEYKRLSGRCLPDVEGRGGEVIQSSEILALPVRQVPQAVIEATFRNARKNLRFMNSFEVRWRDSPPAEMARLQGAQDEVLGSLNAYFQGLIAQGQLPPLDTAECAELLNHLVSATFQLCFAIEQGTRRGLPRGRHRVHQAAVLWSTACSRRSDSSNP